MTAPTENPWPDFAASLVAPQGFTWLFSQTYQHLATPQQALVFRNLQEATQHMIAAQDRLEDLREAFPTNGDEPAPEQHLIFHRAVKDFYNAFYTAMEALMKHSVAYKKELQREEPSGRSVERFIDWIDRGSYPEKDFIVEQLRRGRTFRTVLTHTAELPPHDWMTFDGKGHPLLLRLFGDGAVPKNAEANSTSMPGDWHVIAPVDWHLVLCFMLVLSANFSSITGYQSMMIRTDGAGDSAPAGPRPEPS